MTSRGTSWRRSRVRWAVGVTSMAVAIALSAACGSPESESGERKSPFATGNVSVAPQVEGRPAAPTPVPAPRPGIAPTPSDP